MLDPVVHFVIKAPNLAQMFSTIVQILGHLKTAVLDLKMATDANMKFAIFLDLSRLQTLNS